MPDLRDQISQALKGHGADYVEVRIEEGESTRLLYRGRELEDVGMTTSLGGNVRALVNGGWGFVSFNTIEGLGARVEDAVRQARIVGQETSELAGVDPIVDIVEPQLGKDPRTLTLAQKEGPDGRVQRGDVGGGGYPDHADCLRRRPQESGLRQL